MHVSLHELNERKTSLYCRGASGNEREFPASREVQLLDYTIHANSVFVIFCNAVGRVVRLMQSPWMQHMSTLQESVDWCL